MKAFLFSFTEKWKERWWLPPLVAAGLIACAVGGIHLGKPRYLKWQSGRATRRAQSYLAAGDLEHAGLELKVALRAPASFELTRLLGDFWEATGSDQAVEARQAACRFRPQDDELKLDLARAGLRVNNLPAVAEALAGVAEATKRSVAYRRAEATYAMLSGEYAAGCRLLADLARELPNDRGIQLVADSLQIRSANGATAERARVDLRRLAATGDQRLAALRVLVGDALARQDPLAEREFGTALASTSHASFFDLLTAATAERAGEPASGASAELAGRIQAEAVKTGPAAAYYGRWLLGQNGAATAAGWLAQLPGPIAATPEVAALAADVAAERADWDLLRRKLEMGAWGAVDGPAIELAFTARIARQHLHSPLAQSIWTETLAAAGDSPRTLRVLDRLAEIWAWPQAMRQALFVTAKKFPGDETATARLIGLLKSNRDSHGLLELLALRKDDPSQPDRSRADWALMSLLIAPPAEPNEATRMIEEMYARHPADPFLITDRAFELAQLGRGAEACVLADSLSPDDRQLPQRAAYLAAIYARSGRVEDARNALRMALPAGAMLPEEAQLVASIAQFRN